MILIKRAVLNEHFKQISSLAEVIWREHFTPIIGEKQVLYMLDRFQSYEAIKTPLKIKVIHIIWLMTIIYFAHI